MKHARGESGEADLQRAEAAHPIEEQRRQEDGREDAGPQEAAEHWIVAAGTEVDEPGLVSSSWRSPMSPWSQRRGWFEWRVRQGLNL